MVAYLSIYLRLTYLLCIMKIICKKEENENAYVTMDSGVIHVDSEFLIFFIITEG